MTEQLAFNYTQFNWFEPLLNKSAPKPDDKPPSRNTTERGYGSYHVRLRKQLKEIVATGQATCWRCGKKIEPDSIWHLGHDDYDRSIYRGTEHQDCNRPPKWPLVPFLKHSHPHRKATEQLKAAQQILEQQDKERLNPTCSIKECDEPRHVLRQGRHYCLTHSQVDNRHRKCRTCLKPMRSDRKRGAVYCSDHCYYQSVNLRGRLGRTPTELDWQRWRASGKINPLPPVLSWKGPSPKRRLRPAKERWSV